MVVNRGRDERVTEQLAAMAYLPEDSFAHFLSIEEEKREHILKVALAEFAAHDYMQVSTNTIVKKAGISKGLLFHYFESKAGLYQYLQYHVVTLITRAVVSEVDLSGVDVFDVLWKITESKMHAVIAYPLEMQFYTRSLLDSSVPPDIRVRLDAGVDAAYNTMEMIIANLDEALLKDDLRNKKEQVEKIIDFALEGMSRKVLAGLSPDVSAEFWHEQVEELRLVFDFMRELFYKDVGEGSTR